LKENKGYPVINLLPLLSSVYSELNILTSLLIMIRVCWAVGMRMVHNNNFVFKVHKLKLIYTWIAVCCF
jgi:hypothetical protein